MVLDTEPVEYGKGVFHLSVEMLADVRQLDDAA